jgi:pimeloyl-ACP methyl ester carboxylesterase
MKQTINGFQFNILEQGNGPLTLIFLHYFGGSALEWQVVMDSLSEDHHCVAVDLRGYGDSAPANGFPAETTFSVDDMAEDVLTVIDRYASRNYVLIGHSMSGKVALAIAAGLPAGHQSAGLQSLILVSPSPPVPEPIADDERQKLLDGYGKRAAAEQTLKNITFVAVSEAVRKQIIADDLRTTKPAWMAWLEIGSREDISSRMARVNVPVHIVVGAKDNALPPDVQDRLVLPYLKNATVEIVPGAGHLLPWETPNELAAFITKKIAA